MYNNEWWTEYKKFLKSAQWQAVRRRVFSRYGKRCYCCGSVKTVQVHHISYAQYKNPPINDVVPLCSICHKQLKADQRRSRHRGHALLHYHMRTCKRRKKS